jgi:hypothetical protein
MLHHFAKDPNTLLVFSKVENFRQFKRNIEKYSALLPVQDPLRYGKHKNVEDNINKLRGNFFEIFCELFVKYFGYDPSVGIISYTPTNPEEDEGVDAYGFNLHEERVAVQCKYQGDPAAVLSTENSNIGNFPNEAYIRGNIDYKNVNVLKKLYLITSGNGLHYHTRENLNNLIFEITGRTLEIMTNGNKAFWNACCQDISGV